MNKRILIIEDNEEVRDNLEDILQLSGYETDSAPNGKIGIEKALSNPPDLILCDVMMPELDGFGTLSILSRKPATADVPFIFLTAMAEKSDRRRGMLMGAEDYITKPFYKDELLQVVETRLQKSERLRRRFDKTTEGLRAFIDEARGQEAMTALSREHEQQTITKKSSLFSEGDYPRYLYFLDSGRIKLSKTNDYGKEYIIKVCQAGEFFGYTSLLKDEPYPFSATAMDDSVVSLIPKDAFFSLLQANRDVSARFIKMLTDNIVEKEDQLLQLAYDSIRKRVADALIQLQAKGQTDKIDILREDLAQLVGTAKESVIRTLTEFRKDGLIDIREGTIHILDLQALAQLPG